VVGEDDPGRLQLHEEGEPVDASVKVTEAPEQIATGVAKLAVGVAAAASV
jgi:hypothetical protein